MPIKSVKIKISKNKKMRFFLMSQGSFNTKISFLGKKMCPADCLRTDTQTDRVTTEGTLSGFQDFFLQPIIKDRPNNKPSTALMSSHMLPLTFLIHVY